MITKTIYFRRIFLLVGLGLFTLHDANLFSAEDVDIRRDAVVQAVQKVMPSVVNIATETLIRVRDPWEQMLREFFDPYHNRQPANSQYSLGSGVIIEEDGYILTNDHVVRRADKIWIKLTTGPEIYSVTNVVSDPKTDVAILKIEAKPGQKFTAIKFGADDDLLLGETVLAMGNPFGLGGSVSRGILSSKSRIAPSETEQLDVPNWLQTDASINPGNSGGPLVNLRGELIGMNVAVLRQAQGIGFAVPVKRVSQAISEIFTPEAVRSLWFGAKLKANGGSITVASVQPGSPADKAGLQAGDVILQVNGKAEKNIIPLVEELVASQHPAMTILRNNDRKTINVSLVPESSVFNADLIQQKLGVRLQPITPQLAETMNLAFAEGFVVTSVDKNSPAATLLQRSYLVTAIDGEAFSNLTNAAKMLYAKKTGERARLTVVVQRMQGGFISYTQGDVQVPVLQ